MLRDRTSRWRMKPDPLPVCLLFLCVAFLTSAADAPAAPAQGRSGVRAPAPARVAARPRARVGKKKPPPPPPVEEESSPEPVPAPAAAEATPTPLPNEPAEADEAPAPVPVAEPAPEAAPPSREKPDLGRLRERYEKLRDEVFRARARRETVQNALFSTKFRASLHWRSNRHYRLDRVEVRLDGTRLWESGDRPVGEDPIPLAERSVSPGAHVLAIRIEVRARDNPERGYMSEQSFSIALAEGKSTRVKVVIEEDGDLPSYNPDIEIEVDED